MLYLETVAILFAGLLYKWLGTALSDSLPDGIKIELTEPTPGRFSRFILDYEGQMKTLQERAAELLDNIEIFDRELGASVVELQTIMDRSPKELRRQILIRYDSIFRSRRDDRLESSIRESLKETYDRFMKMRQSMPAPKDDNKTELIVIPPVYRKP